MADLPDVTNSVAQRLEALERRVYALEHPATRLVAADTEHPLPIADQISGNGANTTAVGAFSVLGRALLGIAGAYMLRALTETNLLPSTALTSVAIAYALAWLAWASRAQRSELMPAAVYSTTSALILAPMLWELTLRFNVLSAWGAAGVIAGFVVIGSILGLKRKLPAVVWVSSLAGAGIALALSVASRQMIPFIGVLLMMVLIHEYEAARGAAGGVRIVVSLVADVAIWALIYIYSGRQSARATYPQLSAAFLIVPGVVLFLIVAASVIYRAAYARERMSAFEMAQTTLAFLLAGCGLLYFGSPATAVVLGGCCLAMSFVGYALALKRFDHDQRNQLVFATWSGALLLAGSWLAVPAKVMPLWLGGWAVAANWTGARMLRLHLHSLVFLLVAAAGSGLLNWMAGELAGVGPQNATTTVYVLIVIAIACYAGAGRCTGTSLRQQAILIAFAAIASSAVLALLVQGLSAVLAMMVVPEGDHLAFVRTLAVCMVAMALAFVGAHWHRAELIKVGYTALVLLALKIALEDLRQGRPAFVAASIFLFAVALIAVPRVAKVKAAG